MSLMVKGLRLTQSRRPGDLEKYANGAAAHLVKPGDLVIILSFLHVDANSVHEHKPKIVIVNENNEIVSVTEDEGNP